MSRFHSHLNSAKTIISLYKGEEPLSTTLKKHFSQNKKYGSTDRKKIAHLSYCYFRLGHALKDIKIEDGILIAIFLCENKPDDLLEFYKPEWNLHIGDQVDQKIEILKLPVSAIDIFPWVNELSENIDAVNFSYSHFTQPDLFLRARPGQRKLVKEKLLQHSISFMEPVTDCFALSNTTRIGNVIELNKEAVVQDFSSQRISELIKLVNRERADQVRVWDCCAGSGGKSILASDIFGNIRLTVTDIRKTILANLHQRFEEAGVRNYKSFKLDLSRPVTIFKKEYFDLVIADVPCTGSGTWGRTPEELYFFKKGNIEKFAALQQQIIQNTIPHIKPGGYLLYITCSVFKKENEDAVKKICEKYSMEKVELKWLTGYDIKADTLFGALLKFLPHRSIDFT